MRLRGPRLCRRKVHRQVRRPAPMAAAEAAVTAPVAALGVGILRRKAHSPSGGVDLTVAGRRAIQGGVGVGAHWASTHHVAAGGHGRRCGVDRDRTGSRGRSVSAELHRLQPPPPPRVLRAHPTRRSGGRPITLNTGDHPPADFSDQKVSGLIGRVQNRFNFAVLIGPSIG
jgi:hypothetical protein